MNLCAWPDSRTELCTALVGDRAGSEWPRQVTDGMLTNSATTRNGKKDLKKRQLAVAGELTKAHDICQIKINICHITDLVKV